MKEDLFDPQPNGTIKFVVSGLAFTLRRPKIKEFRLFREKLISLGVDSESSAAEATEAVERGELPPALATEAKRQEKEDELLEWWQLVFKELNDSEKPLPDDDDLPMWLFDGEIIPTVLNTWTSLPPRRGAQ